MDKIKEQLTESTANSFKEIHEGLLDAILLMKKFIIEKDLRNEDLTLQLRYSETTQPTKNKLFSTLIISLTSKEEVIERISPTLA